MHVALLAAGLAVAAVGPAELRSAAQQAAFAARAAEKAAELAGGLRETMSPDFPVPSVTSAEATAAIAAELELAAAVAGDGDEWRRHLQTAWQLYLTYLLRFGEEPGASGEMATCLRATAATLPRAQHEAHVTDDAVSLVLQGRRDEARVILETQVDCQQLWCGWACASARFDRELALVTLELIEGDLASALAAARRAERARPQASDIHVLELALMDMARSMLYLALVDSDAAWEVYRNAEARFAAALRPPIDDETFDWRLHVELVPLIEGLAAQLGETRPR